MTVLTIFNSQGKKEFFIDDWGMLWLNGTLLCKRLGFSNPSKSIPLHTEECDRQKVDVGALHPAWFVNEPGTWSMILGAKTQEAHEFKRHLTTTVLPAIRKEGGYISPEATSTQVAAITSKAILDLFKKDTREGYKALRQCFDLVESITNRMGSEPRGRELSDHEVLDILVGVTELEQRLAVGAVNLAKKGEALPRGF